jgi:stearoyl-CoA desaturase (delta-9 desaturase)
VTERAGGVGTSGAGGSLPPGNASRVRWLEGGFLLAYHVGALLVFLVGFSWPALVGFLVVYWTQIFGLSAGYHRYFSHRSFKTGRAFQILLAVLGGLAAQMGPLWWASHHRRHHRYPDRDGDLHSPVLDGFLWSHVGWVLAEETKHTDWAYVKDWARYPELRWLDRWRLLVPAALFAALFAVGGWLGAVRPGWGTSGLQMLVWGGFLSTAVCYQVTFCVNSLTHLIGSRRFATRDNSRNVALLALLTNGEGWHNNHHRFPASERQGFYWWEWDLTHYILKLLAKLGIVWDIKGPPARVYS